jgi:predicted enzyme related to lactoylglutathione lyase
MATGKVFKGLATVNYWSDDVKAARKWYTELLGVKPYFERPDPENPAYIEFRIGDYLHELGIIDSKFAPTGKAKNPGGATIYWHVDDINSALDRLKELGAKELEPVVDHGGFIVATVVDPFGNILGVMHNPHYLEILDKVKKQKVS